MTRHHSPAPTRRALLKGSALAAAMLAAPWLRAQEAASAPASATAAAVERIPKLTLAGPYASVSTGFIRIVEAGLLADVADSVEFLTWKDPDQLRAFALEGKADFIAMPSNVAANLYNRGVALRLLCISVWRILYIVSSDPDIKTLDDLKGKEVLMPFRGDMPDIVFATLCEKLGISIGQGADAVTLRYTATPLDAMQLLLTRRARHALLAEPAASVGMRKSRSLPVSAIAPALLRSVDMQQEWARAFGSQPRIPQAGITVMGPHMDNAPLVARFMQAYEEAQNWCNAQPDECGKLVAARVDMLTPEGVADSMRAAPGEVVSAAKARAELEFFFEKLAARQPKLIGGKLPGDAFYWNSEA